MKIEYREIDAGAIDLIESLWEKLREHQGARSPHFAQHYANRTWRARKTELLEKARTGALCIDLAKDLDTRKVVAYCVSTVSSKGKGCLESIFVELDYRGNGIGDSLMLRALEWMNNRQAKTVVLEVGVGNEAVIAFYNRYDFYPRTILLQQSHRRVDSAEIGIQP